MPKIAIIDDDPDIVDATRILLENKGFEVVSASNLDDALDLISKGKLDLVLLDVMMDEPDDGFYLANKLRQKGYKMPIILLTSVSKSVGFEFDKGDRLPVDDFIEKPVAPNILIDKINLLLKQTKGN